MRSRLILAFLALTVGTGICHAAEGEAQHTWWGLWNTAHGTSTSATLEGSNDLYVRLTAQNSALLVGGSISGLRFFISDKTAVTALSVWMAARYSNGPQTVTVQRDVPLSALRDMQHDGLPTEVSLEGDIDILPANAYANILVGLTIQVAGGRAMPLLTGSVSGPSGSCFLNSRDMSSAYGALPLQVLGCGPLLPAEGATPMTIGEQVEMAGQPATLTLPVSNSGAAAVTDVAYIVSIDGDPQPEQFYQLPATVDELGNQWRQSNGYNDYAGPDAALLAYAGRGAYLYDMVYNHVAIDIMGVDGGISGSISTPLRSDAPQHYACTFNIGGNALVQHPDKLNLVVMLTDTRDGSVVNAAVAHVKPFGSSDGISETVSRQPAPHHYYDLQGRRLHARPQSKGIYIAGGRKYLRRCDAATTQLYQKDDENQ